MATNQRPAPLKSAAKKNHAKPKANAKKAAAVADSGNQLDVLTPPKHITWFKAEIEGAPTYRQFEVTNNTLLIPDVGFSWRRANMVDTDRRSLKRSVFYDVEGKEVPSPVQVIVEADKYQVHFKQNLPDWLSASMMTDYPKYKITHGKGYHSHGGLAATRKFYETVIYNLLINEYPQGVVDVGGSVRRHSGRNVHSLNPTLLVGDIKRNQEASRILQERGQTVTSCNHQWHECDCPQAMGKPYMSVHSLYYLHDTYDETFYAGPKYIYNAMITTGAIVFMALHHALDQTYYQYKTDANSVEGSYYREGNIVMSVADNTAAYDHKPLDWLSVRSYRPPGFSAMTLVWDTKVLSAFDLRITTFRLVDRLPEKVIPRDLTTYTEIANWVGHGGVVNSATPVKRTITRVINGSLLHKPGWFAYSYNFVSPVINFISRHLNLEFGLPVSIIRYGNLVIFGTNKEAVIDVGLHHWLMHKVAKLKKIDDQTIDALFNLAKNYNNYNQVPSFDSNRSLQNTITYTIDRLMDEGLKFYNNLKDKADEIRHYNEVAENAFTPKTKETTPYLTYCLIGGAAMFLAYKYHKLLTPSLLATVVRKEVEPIHYVIGTLLITTAKIAKREALAEPEATLAVCTRGVEVPDIGTDAEGVPLHEVDYVDEEACKLMYGNLKMVGLYNRRAYICKPCVHNLHNGARFRLLHRSDTESAEWLNNNNHKMWKMLWGDNLQPTNFEQWVSRFPGARKRVLTKAHHEITYGGVVIWDPRVREWFIKKENYVKGSEFGYELIKPRIISGPNLYYLVHTGPISHAIGTRAKVIWNGVNSNILYTSGYNANQLGRLYDMHVEELGGKDNVIVLEGDASSFEASVKKNQYLFVKQLLIKMGVEPDYITWIDYQWKTNQFRTSDEFGNKLSVKFSAIRHSGDGLTSFGNSVVNVKSIQIVFGDLIDKCKIWVLGDDNMILIPKIYYQINLEIIKEKFREIGFDMKLVVSTVYTASFCSGLFYPTSAGTIWGPKISRVMTRTFTCHHNYVRLGRKYYDEWIRQVAIGLSLDVKFIPGLRVIVTRLKNLDVQNVKLPNQHKIDYDLQHKLHNTIDAELVDETYSMLYEVYDLTKFDFDSLEDYLKTVQLGPNLNHYVFDKIVEKDVPIDDQYEGNPTMVYSLAAITTMLATKSWENAFWFATALFDATGELIEITPKIETLNYIKLIPDVTHNFLFYACTQAPFVEEGYKECLIQGGFTEFQAGLAFGLYELVMKYRNWDRYGTEFNARSFLAACGTVLVHSFLIRGSYRERVQKHILWNCFVLSPMLIAWGLAEFLLE